MQKFVRPTQANKKIISVGLCIQFNDLYLDNHCRFIFHISKSAANRDQPLHRLRQRWPVPSNGLVGRCGNKWEQAGFTHLLGGTVTAARRAARIKGSKNVAYSQCSIISNITLTWHNEVLNNCYFNPLIFTDEETDFKARPRMQASSMPVWYSILSVGRFSLCGIRLMTT